MKGFLQLPLKLQINIFLIILFILTLLVVFAFSQSISAMHFQNIKNKNLDYFTSMERDIFESEMQFINIVILQYENIIKFFNSEIYHYNSNRTLLQYFQNRSYIPTNITEQRIHVFNNISELNEYPDYNESLSDDEKKLYIYCDANNVAVCNIIIELIKVNALSNLNQNKAIRNFKFPFYGDIPLIDEYIYLLKYFSTIFSGNNTKMKELINRYRNFDNLFIKINASFIDKDYQYHNNIFEEYSNNKIKLLELMYNKTFHVFQQYKYINNAREKDDYIKNHSIYFQILDFEKDFTYFFNSWDANDINIIGGNEMISNYLSTILFNISKSLDFIILPINNATKILISKNACYFLIIKQLFYLWIRTNISYDEKIFEKIYTNIYNGKDITDINICKLNAYYEDLGEEINLNNDIFNYYDLENTVDTYLYKLIKNDHGAYIFEMKLTYPNFESLKAFYPNFFNFHQLNFYTFKLSSNLSRIILTFDSYVNNVNYLIILILWFFWLLIAIIFTILISLITPKITKPIERLTQIINLNANDFKNKKIFEYDLDDDINKFFSLCKNLIDGEMINNDLKLNEILEDKTLDDSYNNNMIINNKMIMELIENQKCLSNNDKNIFLLKEVNYSDKKKKTIRSPKIKSKKINKNINHLDVIKLISLNDGENSERNSIVSSKIKENKPDLYSYNKEEDAETNNLKLYEELIKITDYVFHGKEKDKTNKMRKNIDKSSSVSKKSKQENNIKIIKGINNIAYYWYNNEKENRNIRRYTNIYS